MQLPSINDNEFNLLKKLVENTASGGGGGGAVSSVNGQTGVVVLDAEDVGLGETSSPTFNGIGLAGTSPADNSVVKFVKDFPAMTTGPSYGVNSVTSGSKTASAFTGYLIGGVFHSAVSAANTKDWTGDGIHVPLVGAWGQVDMEAGSTGTVSEAASINAVASLADGIMTKWFGCHVKNPTITGGGEIKNAHGLYIRAITSGTVSNYGVYVEPGVDSYFGGGIMGSVGTNDASSGNIGEYLTASLLAVNAVNVPTATNTNVTSLILTPGDWDVTGVIQFLNASGTVNTVRVAAISTSSATLPDLDSNSWTVERYSYVGDGNATLAIQAPTIRIKVTVNTTVYLVARSVITISTQTAFGVIRARRSSNSQ